jgi:hypothetical protein
MKSDCPSRLTHARKLDEKYSIYVCSCGNEKRIRRTHVNAGAIRSCGCLNKDQAAFRGSQRAVHGMWKTPDFARWQTMIYRCHTPSARAFQDYGGRGIYVCDRWRECFLNFYEDMGSPPTPAHSLDRKDNNGPYCKENCRWATDEEQNNNLRSSVYVSHNGESKTYSRWSREFGLNPGVLRARLRAGWPMDRALKTAVRKLFRLPKRRTE